MATPDIKTPLKESDLVTIDSKGALGASQILMSQNGPKNAQIQVILDSKEQND